MIYAWDNYPLALFPPLWDWIAEQVAEAEIAIPAVAFEEIRLKTPDCAAWLQAQGITILPMGPDEVNEAVRIKGLLGIADDRYHPKGVGENDLFIIATSKLEGVVLVSDEERQPNRPQVPSKMKIPAVCGLETVEVTCINFLDYIKQSGQVFR